MNYTRTNHLTKTILTQLDALPETEYIPFYEENLYCDYSAFHFLTENNRLVSFMGIMPVSENTVELTAYTFPGFRHQGHFTFLLKNVMNDLVRVPSLRILSAQKLLFPFIKNNVSHQEYLMMLNHENYTVKSCENKFTVLEYICESEEETEYIYILKQNTENNTALGILKITCETGSETACLHHVKIRRQFRNRGYGFLLISRALELFRNNKNCDIVLHVTSTNTAAFHLYQKLGFQIIQSLEYYHLELPENQ